MGTPDTFDHLFWGYAAIWFCIAAFVLVTNAAQRRQQKRLELLEREIERAGLPASPEEARSQKNSAK